MLAATGSCFRIVCAGAAIVCLVAMCRVGVAGRRATILFARWIEASGPLATKLAQILSTRVDLFPERVCDVLGTVRERARSDRATLAAIRRRRQVLMEPARGSDAIAAGCLAAVYHRVLADGRSVACKVRKPRAARLLARDLASARTTIGWAARWKLIAPQLSDAAGRILDAIAGQIDFEHEACLHDIFERNFRGQQGIRIPMLLRDLCDDDLIVMQLVERCGSIATLPCTDEGERYARLTLRCLYQMIFRDGLVHGDMHPGNILIDAEGNLALIDFGLAWQLSRDARIAFAEFFLGFVRSDGAACAGIALRMAAYVPADLDESRFRRDVQRLLDASNTADVASFSVAGFALAMFGLQRRHRVVSTIEFIAPIFALLMLEGCLKRLAPKMDFKAEARSFVLSALAGVQRKPAELPLG